MTNTREPMAKQIDYTIADNSFEWMHKNPDEVDKFDDGGPGMEFSYAGGYGFWCNKACAARKDAVAKAQNSATKALTSTDTTTAAALAALNAPLPSPSNKSPSADSINKSAKKSNTPMIIAIVTGLAVVSGAAYMMLRKKK